MLLPCSRRLPLLNTSLSFLYPRTIAALTESEAIRLGIRSYCREAGIKLCSDYALIAPHECASALERKVWSGFACLWPPVP